MKRLFGLSLLAAVACLAQPMQRPQPLVAVEKVTYQQEEDIRRYTGRIVSPASVLVVTRVSGEIIEVGFKDGEMVKKGQMLYKLDPVQYFATMKACEARVASGKATVSQCQASVTYAKNSYERNLKLFEKAVISEDAMDVSKRDLDTSNANLEAAKAALMEAEANLIKAKDDYKNTTIVAPMDALAGVTNKTVGNYITPSTGTLVTLLQTTPIRARFAISMNEYLTFLDDNGKVAGEPLIKMKLANGKDYEHNGKLEFIDNETNRNTDAVHIYALFPNDNGVLIHGSTVSMYLRFRSPRKSLAVYPSCIMHDAKSAYVYVIDNAGKVTRQDVTLGLATPEFQFITSGLKEGDIVVKDGMHKTMPGDTVQTTEQDTVNRGK
ncbi:MAG: efflux RND transporter periplasmic adaptor subunit [Victivallales bacterium]|nr:efflux RND transporter periplasmic adaptor subunit [Victivallales bacterium]